ncbi:hypothetical protein TNCV_939461 [Trichonephila clavipes]|nr:hypothetical protein TNCV_939461 [Trichonephila clavipes]
MSSRLERTQGVFQVTRHLVKRLRLDVLERREVGSEPTPVNRLVIPLFSVPERLCCRVSAADKRWRVYQLDHCSDAVALYSECTQVVSHPKQIFCAPLKQKFWKDFLTKVLFRLPHNSLNSCRGVVSESDLLSVSEAEILEGLSDQGVTQKYTVRRSTKTNSSTVIPIIRYNLPNPPTATTAIQTDENITKIVCPPLKLLQPLISVPKPISSSVHAVTKSSTSIQAELLPSPSSVTVTSSSKSHSLLSVIDTAPATSNNLSTSIASSSSTLSMSTPLPACPVLEIPTNTASNNIPATSQDTNQTLKPRRKKRPFKIQSSTIKPKIENKMAPHRSRKSAPTDLTADDEDMITYDVEE